MSKNALDAFEQRLKDSLEQFEVPYNSSDWNQLERSLNNGRSSWWFSAAGISLLFTATLGLAGGTWMFLGKDRPNDPGANVAQTTVTTNAAQINKALLTDTNPTTQPSAVEQRTTSTTSGSTPASENNLPGHHTSERANTNNAASSNQQRPSGATPSSAAKTGSAGPTETGDPTGKGASPIATRISEEGMGMFTASVSEGCVGTTVDFKVEHMPEDGIYLWNFGDGSFSNKANPEHTFTKPGSYQVMLSMSAAGVGTIHNKPSSDHIVIHDVPKAAFNVLKQEYDGHLPSVHFENRSLSASEYHWSFGDGETSTIAHPDHIYKTKGVYQVELTVTNEIGCTDKVLKEVRIDKDYNLDAPASFSPNGDGHEETFMPEALRSLGMKFKLAIYDANGTLIYETTDATKPWLGKPANRGELCSPGDYVWVADVRENLHLGETYTGKVRLDR